MKFRDAAVESFDPLNIDDVFSLIVEYLCGQKYQPSLNEESNMRSLLEDLIDNARYKGLNYEQFNDLASVESRQSRQTLFQLLFWKG